MLPNGSYATHDANRRLTDGAGNDTETGFLRGRYGCANRGDDVWTRSEIFHRLDEALLGRVELDRLLCGHRRRSICRY
jgi:hypothetical protein